VRLKQSYALVLLSAFVLGAACHDAISPPVRHQATIFAIQTSQRAAIMDTIRISFHYSTSPCDTAVVFESQLMSDGIRLGVSSVGTDRLCPIAVTAVYQPPFLYVVGPPHQAPFTVRFAEPGEADSVRIVAAP
jgi:hypothetical protein